MVFGVLSCGGYTTPASAGASLSVNKAIITSSLFYTEVLMFVCQTCDDTTLHHDEVITGDM